MLSVSAIIHGQASFHNAREVQIRSTLASVTGTRLASRRPLDYVCWPNNLKLPVCMQEVVHRVAARGTIDVRVDGPYGYASEPEWTLYDTVVMVAGGIGVSFLHCLGADLCSLPLHTLHTSAFTENAHSASRGHSVLIDLLLGSRCLLFQGSLR